MKLWIAIVVLMLASAAEAGEYLPEGQYKKDSATMRVTSDGDYQITRSYEGGTRDSGSGFALHEGSEVCSRGDKNGNLWTVSSSGSGQCYAVAIRGKRLIIDNLGDPYTHLGGVWVRQ